MNEKELIEAMKKVGATVQNYLGPDGHTCCLSAHLFSISGEKVLKLNAIIEAPLKQHIAEVEENIREGNTEFLKLVDKLIELQLRLDAWKKQEPVAWRRSLKHGWEYRTNAPSVRLQEREKGWMPLYASPKPAEGEPK